MLNCYDKTVIFSSILSSESVTPISLYLNSLSLDCYRNEGQGYVLISTNVLEYEKKLNEIPVIREYLNMFLEDILEFPSKKGN